MKEIHGPVVLDVPSDSGSLCLVRALVERIGRVTGFTGQETDRMVLAVDEACANIIRYAYGERLDERIIVTFLILSDRLEIRIRDFGKQADPERLKSRDLADVRPGGLGIHFIQCAMDEVRYEPQKDGGTLLVLVKQRTPREGEEE